MSTVTYTISPDFWYTVDNNENFYVSFTTFKRAILRYLAGFDGSEKYDKISLITPCIGEYERLSLANFNGMPGYNARNAGIRNFKNNFAMKIDLNISEL